MSTGLRQQCAEVEASRARPLSWSPDQPPNEAAYSPLGWIVVGN